MYNTSQARPIFMPGLIVETSSYRLNTAYHIVDALPTDFLHRLDTLRPSIPLDLSRPTCPRRFLSEWEGNPGDPKRHRENGWVTLGINQAIKSWKLDVGLEAMPWFRFLEYPPKHDGMPPHTDGSNTHPYTETHSVATMLIYLSDCSTDEQVGDGDGDGGGTTLYIQRKLTKKEKKIGEMKSQQVLESFPCKRNTAIIFPHQWLHAGDPVGENHKIAFRCELLFSMPSFPGGIGEDVEDEGTTEGKRIPMAHEM